VVSEAFYPFTGFTSATEADDRRMRWNTRPFYKTDFDSALETAAETGWALYELGHRHIPELLDAHPSAEPVHLGVPVKFPDGWEAHQAFMAHLAKHRVCAA